MVDEVAAPEPGAPSRGDRLRGIAFLLLAAIGAALVVLGLIAERSVPPVEPGRALPATTVRGLDGAELALSSLQGRVVLLDFWATWCPPCVESLPALDRLASERASDGVVALAVNGDAPDGQAEAVRRFVAEHRLTSLRPVLDDGSLARSFGVSALPTLIVVGADGRVRASRLGGSTLEELRALVDEARAAAPKDSVSPSR